MGELNEELACLRKILPFCWTRQTSTDPEGWTKENPAWGQSAVTAVAIYDIFGGDILQCVARSKLEEREVYHYYNLTSKAEVLDLSSEQFRNLYRYCSPVRVLTRQELQNDSRVCRSNSFEVLYEVFKKRLQHCYVLFRQLSDEDQQNLMAATTFEELTEVALIVIRRLDILDRPSVGMVFGPITTGGLGSKEANMAVFKNTIYKLVADGNNIFSQLPFESHMWRIMQTPYYQGAEHLMESFYGRIFKENVLGHVYFIHGWEGSYGASWEHKILKGKIPFIYLVRNF